MDITFGMIQLRHVDWLLIDFCILVMKHYHCLVREEKVKTKEGEQEQINPSKSRQSSQILLLISALQPFLVSPLYPQHLIYYVILLYFDKLSA